MPKDNSKSTSSDTHNYKKIIIIGAVFLAIILLGLTFFGVYAHINGINIISENRENDSLVLPRSSENTKTKNTVVESVISDIQVTNITKNSAVVTWKTNKPMTSIVDYGFELEAYVWTTGDGTETTDHSIQINSLSSNTVYYIRAKSTEKINEETIEISKEGGSFKTLEDPDEKVQIKPKTPPVVPPVVENNGDGKKNEEKIDPYASYTTYQNDIYGYEFKYDSKKWVVEEMSKESVEVNGYVAPGEPTPPKRFGNQSYGRVGVGDPGNETLEVIKSRYEGSAGYRVDDITVDGVPAVSITDTNFYLGDTNTFFLKDNKLYKVHFQNNNSDVATLFWGTFKFTK